MSSEIRFEIRTLGYWIPVVFIAVDLLDAINANRKLAFTVGGFVAMTLQYIDGLLRTRRNRLAREE